MQAARVARPVARACLVATRDELLRHVAANVASRPRNKHRRVLVLRRQTLSRGGGQHSLLAGGRRAQSTWHAGPHACAHQRSARSAARTAADHRRRGHDTAAWVARPGAQLRRLACATGEHLSGAQTRQYQAMCRARGRIAWLQTAPRRSNCASACEMRAAGHAPGGSG